MIYHLKIYLYNIKNKKIIQYNYFIKYMLVSTYTLYFTIKKS